jgi:UDP-N-acetylmuramate--L-alanine ligase
MIGILGAGMRALAQLYLQHGYRVSGSDLVENDALAPLRDLGADISIGHIASIPLRLHGVDRVVVSPAIPRNNSEWMAARALGLPVVSRASALAGLIRTNEVICVAGSHGKSTTTALLSCVLEQAERPTGYMVGAECEGLQGKNAHWHPDGLFVNESCEAFRALDHWHPNHCIVTNIDDEHSDHYGGFNNLRAAFVAFIERTPKDGKILLCDECPTLREIATSLGDGAERQIETYGFGKGAFWRARIQRENEKSTVFKIWRDGKSLGRVTVNLAGQHMVLNALAAFAMASNHGIQLDAAKESLSRFRGVNRRWQPIGSAAGVSVFDDMAHHPTEIAATLSVARKTADGKGRVLAVIQPQLHSRVSRLTREFANALRGADEVIVLPIDDAGERTQDQNSQALLNAALLDAGIPSHQATTTSQATQSVSRLSKAGDIIVTMGPELAKMAASTLLATLKSAPHGRATECLQSRFEEQANSAPDAPCVLVGDTSWTYAEIETLANKAAHALAERGLVRGSLVALSMNRTAELLALTLGVLKAGCAFVPIDPKIARTAQFDLLGSLGGALLIHDDSLSCAHKTTMPSIHLDAFFAHHCKAPPAPFAPANSDDLAYGIFTSGSTGTPKLVGVTHRNVCNLITTSAQELFEPADRALTPFIDSISFDAAIHQIFATFASGGCLLIEPDLAGLLRSPHFSKVTSLGGTPTVIARLVQMGALPKALRVISLGGEVIPEQLVKTLRSTSGIQKAFNFYGPTETTIFSSVARILDRGDQPVASRTDTRNSSNNIGHAINGTTIRVRNQQGQDVAVGEVGEIYISGEGVAQGYLGDPQLTAQKFREDAGGRTYGTGDLGRQLQDGSIEFLGRIDDQLKIRGVRIDPEEIELHLNACAGVQRAAVVAEKDAQAGDKLVAFVVADPDSDLGHVASDLALKVPIVMVPKSILRIDALPMTATGKINRRALAAHIPKIAPAPRTTPATPEALDGVERRLTTIWRRVLRNPNLGPHDDFFNAGGDSLASMEMILAAEQAFGQRLSAQIIENLETVAIMAEQVRNLLAGPIPQPLQTNDMTQSILAKQRAYLAAWKGESHAPESLIRSFNTQGKEPALFWCFQGFHELRALAAAFAPDRPIHGMRSGYQIMAYTPDTISILAQSYSEELMRLQPEGPFLLGGNCQGSSIARATAFALRAQGREVKKLILMEHGTVWPYDQNLGLIFGRESPHNPFLTHADPNAALNAAYKSGHELRLISGKHGEYFDDKNIGALANVIRELTAP